MNSRLKKLFVQRTKTETATTNIEDISPNSECKTLVLSYINVISEFISK